MGTTASKTLAEQPPAPHYKIHDPAGHPEGNFTVRIITIDSDEGRAYAQLTTDADRLAYMREHAHRSWDAVRVDSAFFEDAVAGKTYEIKMNSPEYEGLKRLLREDGTSWPPGTRGFDAMVQYYRQHATAVRNLPANS
jgi:hypothetical protein